ncbi:winged helix-turn-helix domain-containing protein (plasmid) [Haladaptatus sp. SPP-AMP-3]|uniref:winged helix-turn-helix domain-containing protein n=1 Tax=Haladaptatus sp. SPP-AMP-3 TaxID=3121295 RepID=UPI003C2ED24D
MPSNGFDMTYGTDSAMDELAVLGNEIRMSILRELADASGSLSFTELRERVGVRDTGKFNYHLTKLCEYFVRQTDSGYELGHAGTRVITAATSETATEFDANGGDDSCPVCGEQDCEKLFHVHLTPNRF